MKEEKKDLHLMVEEQIHSRLKAAAAECRVSLTSYCTSMILKGKVISPIDKETLLELRKFTNGGTNLQTIAKKLAIGETDRMIIAIGEEAVITNHAILKKIYEVLNQK